MSTDLDGLLASLGGARRFADPNAPLDARLMAASGALPLPPPQLLSVLYALTLDPDGAVKDKALASLRALPDRVLGPALEAKVHPDVLGLCAQLFRDDGPRLEKIALNPASTDDTCVFLAGLPHGRVIEILAQNQVRLDRVRTEIAAAEAEYDQARLENSELSSPARITERAGQLGLVVPEGAPIAVQVPGGVPKRHAGSGVMDDWRGVKGHLHAP